MRAYSGQISGPCERSVPVVQPENHVSRGGTIMNNWKATSSACRQPAVKAGDNPKINVPLQEVASSNEGEADPLQNVETLRSNRIKVSFDTYENIFPAGAGRDVAERTCILCHGENFLPSQPGSAEVWNARVDRMMGKANFDRPA